MLQATSLWCLWLQIDNVGANVFTGGITWIEVPVGTNDPPRAYIEADTSTRWAAFQHSSVHAYSVSVSPRNSGAAPFLSWLHIPGWRDFV